MRSLPAFLTLIVVGVCLLAYAAQQETTDVAVRLRLEDADTGNALGGIVRIAVAGKEEPLVLSGLFNRMRGLGKQESAGWYVVPRGGADIRLPRTRLRLEAV